MAAGEDHAQRPLGADRAGQAVDAAGQGGEADAHLGQGEQGVLGGDDEVAGEGDLEPTAHRHAVDGGDQRLVEVVAGRDAAEAGRRLASCGRRRRPCT